MPAENMTIENSSQKNVWKGLVAKYQKSNSLKSAWQIANTFLPFISLLYLMYLSTGINYGLTLLLAVPAAGFVIRLFIIQHDCGHRSFFSSRKANDTAGFLLSIFTLTPYHYWKKSHSIHHAGTGNLDQRGIGDIYTMTVNEYSQLSAWGKLKYRTYRNPFILFIVLPFFLFTVIYRFPSYITKELKPFHKSVYITDLLIGLLAGGIIWSIGIQAFLMILIPVYFISSTAGMWIFYVQHQFEDTYWNSSEEWDYTQAAIKGSSYYKLPKVLQWFTGNIGFHHIHHLSPKIPNYRLENCHNENPEFRKAKVLTLRSSMRSILLDLWDEKRKKLISFYRFKRLNHEMNYIP
jgi:omega-6 fatty acid desaturase (delta-12 desaturase)